MMFEKEVEERNGYIETHPVAYEKRTYTVDEIRDILQKLVEELELVNLQLAETEEQMKAALGKLEIGQYLLSIKGLGVVSLGMDRSGAGAGSAGGGRPKRL